MNDKKRGLILCILDITIVILLCLIIFIIPSIKDINKLKSTKELTYEEKTKLINEINEKYNDDLTKIVKKYNDLDNYVKNKYDPEIETINTKYDNLITEKSLEYETKEKELKNTLATKKAEQNKEFFKNGLSKKYYTLEDEIDDLNTKITNLNSELNKEIESLTNNKKAEVNPVVINKNSLLKHNELNKSEEIDRLNIEKNKEINKINKNTSYTSNLIIDSLILTLGIIIILVTILYIVKTYNKLTKLNNKIEESWSTILIELKRRTDLIPNIVKIVKSSSNYEKNTLKDVISARNKVAKSTNKLEEINNNKLLEKNIKEIYIVNEKYPELKTNEQYKTLINELKEIEKSISTKRTEYNKNVLIYTNLLETFPSNLIAKLFNFKKEEFFKTNDKENISVGDLNEKN